MLHFQIKKIISHFLMPMPLVCEFFLLGWVLTRFTRYKKTGKCFTLLSLLLFLLSGYGFGRVYLYNLERKYPPFEPTPGQCEDFRGTAIVVLGQGMPERSDIPVRYQNNSVFERRLFEGVRVAKIIPASHLIVSMAGDASNSVKQAFLNEYMLQVNFPTNRVTMFTTARDTAEEAKLAKQAIEKCANARMRECAKGGAPLVSSIPYPVSNLPTNALTHYRTNALANFRTLELPRRGVAPSEAGSNFRTNSLILATSASHIPRAMRIFQRHGLNPIASPCDYTDTAKPKLIASWSTVPFPSAGDMDISFTAMHEWFGGIYEGLMKK